MANWYDLKVWCPDGGWISPVEHVKTWDKRGVGDCPVAGGKILIDIDTGDHYCTACGRTWKPENFTFYCSCGRVIRTQYQDSVVVVGRQDRLLGYDGDVAYVLTASGVIVVARREYVNIGAAAAR